MYSTLIILSGYTFGTIPGFILSYTAALSGALTVFLLSRHLRPIQTPIQHWLAHTPASIRAAVRAIEKRPRLLFLVRLAPYPYNVMNCLLGAAAPSLSVGRYVGCTALSLVKVVVHTGVGSGIHSFKDYHKDKEVGVLEEEETNSERLARVWTIVGIVMCVVIFVYLSWCARRAVNEELGDEAQDEEERQRFLEDEEMGQVQHAPLQVSNN
ncbi:hypothetical protein VNI00_005699 [Paramarasmius palmivorus]|uniref:Golgi apparatus membrane protein TVP38 n=1 Tax=Paramarasmius palmivorus TaxID=297713 RepID=A0AAW0DDR6_9AGAR